MKSRIDEILSTLDNQVDLEKFQNEILASIESIDNSVSVCEFGIVHSVADGIATLKGLTSVGLDEVVRFGEDGPLGIVKELHEFEVKVALIDRFDEIKQGSIGKRTHSDFKIPVSQNLVGRVVDIFGQAIDGLGEIKTDDAVWMSIEAPATKMINRQPVTEPLITGTIAIDAMIPIGLGQRELILGDRQTGKTSITLNAIINQMYRYQAGEPMYCVYVAIGQKTDKIISVYEKLKESGAIKYTTIVSASAADSASAQFLAPYVGCTIAEYFMKQGKHTLVVYDDLSKHATAHREISRLLGRPAGRDAFPADSFYTHARLLERAACINKADGGGSMTALPIIETQDSDISGFVATNVISITDGQLFLDPKEFYAQQRPAIDIGLSVSRIGSSAQIKAIKKVSRTMKSELSQYAELYSFLQLTGGTIDKTQTNILQKGKHTKYLTCQDEDERYTLVEEIILICGAHYGLFANMKNNDRKFIRKLKSDLIQLVYKDYKKIVTEIESTNDISEEGLATLKKATQKLVGDHE